jgi:pimeloyl-ACP methyl ester carboxylesterase
MPTLRANGIDIAYTSEGAGPPMVLLHGATSSALEDWSAQRPLFRKVFHLYLPDARGHGGTRWDAADGFTRDMLVDDLAGFVDALGLQTFHLVGFSMGAMTALTYACRYPERLRTLLIAGIDVQRQPRARVAARLMDPERIERDEPAWATQLERRHGPVQGQGAWKRLLHAIQADVSTQELHTPETLSRVRVPTLMAYGDRDVFVPIDHVVSLYRQLPEARLFVAPECGHQVMVTRAGAFNEAAASFYRSTERRARERAGAAAVPPGAPTRRDATGAVRAVVMAPIPETLPDLDDDLPGDGATELAPPPPAGRGPDRESDWFQGS